MIFFFYQFSFTCSVLLIGDLGEDTDIFPLDEELFLFEPLSFDPSIQPWLLVIFKLDHLSFLEKSSSMTREQRWLRLPRNSYLTLVSFFNNLASEFSSLSEVANSIAWSTPGFYTFISCNTFSVLVGFF